jgi:hypothetical protein
VEVVQVHRLQPDILADEVLELAGRDFAEALEARDLMACAEFALGRLFLLLGVAVDRRFLFRTRKSGVSRMKRCPLRIRSGKNWRKNEISSRRMCMPSTSASVAITTLL